MNHFPSILPGILREQVPVVLATIIDTQGSAPQVPGATAIFSREGLLHGTLGGGILEATAQSRAMQVLEKNEPILFEFGLDADLEMEEGAICGGSALILLDYCSSEHRKLFQDLSRSMEARQPGTLVTTISNNDKEGTSVVRNWIPLTDIEKNKVPPELIAAKEAIQDCLAEKKTKYLVDAMPAIFIQPAIPLPRLVIAGAGHIGKALAHLGDLLEFEVTVIDDREEYCNEDRIPDAHHLVVRDIGEAIRLDPKTPDTYLVIVTRGHRDDAAALRNAIDSGMAYIGMIGSKTKVAMMRRQFIEEGWATSRQLERVFAPIGLDIRSKTVQEIAISIAAQLVMVRQQSQTGKDRVGAVILAAGESKRMGTPKQLLPFGESTMIEEIIGTLKASNVANIIVVLGAHFDAIASRLEKYPVAIARNRQYKKGMLTSLQAGLKKLPDDTTKIAVLLGDQPMIRADIINQLIHALGHSDKTMAVPVYNKKWGHPVLLEAIHREGIEGLGPDQTLRDYLQAHRGDILEVAMNHPEIHRDIDTIDDYHNELKYRR